MDARELSECLPPPRDDEPASLRQDILDELADHLQCALRRELLATADERAARVRVVERFGDPGAIARRLWFQAMWSKIMTQRLLLGAVGLLTVVCLALAGVTVWFIEQQRVRAAQQQQLVAEMLERMARLAETKTPAADGAAPRATTASSIQVKLTLDTDDGPPATDHVVALRQLGFEKDKATSERTDASGTADFGYCDPGRYELTVRTPWGFASEPKRFVLHPATAHVEQVACPDPPQVPVSVVATLPADLEQAGVRAFAYFESGTLAHASGNWQEGPIYGHQFAQAMLVRSDGLYIVRPFSEGSQVGDFFTGLRRWVISATREETPGGRIVPGPRYTFRGLRLVVPLPRSEEVGRGPGKVTRLEYEHIAPKLTRVGLKEGTRPGESAVRMYPLELEFTAAAGKPNEWVVPVPAELIEQARQYLKDHPPVNTKDP